MCTERVARWLSHRSARGAAIATLLAVGACNGTSSYMDASGSPGRSEATLGWWLTGAACAVVLIVCVAILLGMARHRNDPRRGEEGVMERREVKSGLTWIYVGVAITVVVLAISLTGTMVTLNAASRPRITPSLTVDVTAHQWWWEVTYSQADDPSLGFTTANEIHLPVGEPVRVRLHSADVIHSFWLPQIAGKMDVIPGQVNETWVEARKPGSSRGMCGEYCGMQHATMALEVAAEPPAAFQKWADERRGVAAAPQALSASASAGRVVFARTCGACHAVSGTEALGRFAPDLTHFASRSTIGAGALTNTSEHLASWIRNAPGVKEGARMPAIPLSDAELRDVIAYLETLH